MEQTTRLALLLDAYEPLLTSTQARLMRMRVDDDLSLGEIGEECGVSRQAARDAIRKGEEKLRFFEDNLHLVSLRRSLSEMAAQLNENAISPREAAKQIRQLAEGTDGV